MDTTEFLIYMAAGFGAQLIDGTLSMAFGVSASTILMSTGLPPATVSATVHAAECFSTGASALSHRAFGNFNKALFWRLLLPGVAGAVIGAYLLTNLPGDALRPFIATYLLLMGFIIVWKAFRKSRPRVVKTHIRPLGFFGVFMDAIGGGGWGPIVATTLIVRGNHLRETVGTVCAVEFFVTLAASVTFFLTIGLSHMEVILGLASGALLAAPLGAWFCKIIPIKPLMIFMGCVVIALSAYNFAKSVFL